MGAKKAKKGTIILKDAFFVLGPTTLCRKRKKEKNIKLSFCYLLYCFFNIPYFRNQPPFNYIPPPQYKQTERISLFKRSYILRIYTHPFPRHQTTQNKNHAFLHPPRRSLRCRGSRSNCKISNLLPFPPFKRFFPTSILQTQKHLCLLSLFTKARLC